MKSGTLPTLENATIAASILGLVSWSALIGLWLFQLVMWLVTGVSPHPTVKGMSLSMALLIVSVALIVSAFVCIARESRAASAKR